MRRSLAFWLVAWLLALVFCAACRREAAAPTFEDASTPRAITVHVPAALRVARAIDSLSVEIDPASRADTTVSVDPGMTIGVETDSQAFVIGQPDVVVGSRHGRASGGDFDVGIATWNTAQDAVPQIDKKYVVEMKVVLFETDTPPARASSQQWDPHAGHFKALFTRTLRQAEE